MRATADGFSVATLTASSPPYLPGHLLRPPLSSSPHPKVKE
ncbi:hypothetical protein HMPREF9056_00307 [Actinomyces sp. oral taxon 170 str. F0386]|nr:hypothetical protein HMPREF9056_00307 [Actinomyces sp. oral taxon 170 str. F0386]